MARTTKVTKGVFRRALREDAGNVTALAARFNVERQTIYNYLRRWDLEDERLKAKHNIISASEDTIYDKVMEGDFDAARFVLTHHPRNKERWTSKQEVVVGQVPISDETLRLLEAMGVGVEDVAAQFEALVREAALADDGA